MHAQYCILSQYCIDTQYCIDDQCRSLKISDRDLCLKSDEPTIL